MGSADLPVNANDVPAPNVPAGDVLGSKAANVPLRLPSEYQNLAQTIILGLANGFSPCHR